ncbi:MAG TPA: clostripain-related cysteine peptidase, partial [Bacillota bacterium]|nr:clostripain-related cysteine peptidase [Bacillota bacterium]
AEVSDKVNIIVETGGAKRWQNTVISSSTNQRYRVTSEGLVLLQDNLGRKSMVDPNTLSDFIRYSTSHYPADRYALVLWDHGGGSLTGFGYDEFYPGKTMDLGDIATALKQGDCTFDWIGFDACLMGTFETAIVLEPFADYMIASEELEPGIGWDYTGWITALSSNTSIPTVDLGKILIDDYIADVKVKTPQSQATLSLIDLAEFKGTVPQAFVAFAESTSELIDANQYKKVSDARADSKEFARSSQINQIDLIHFTEKLATPESQAFASVLRGCVKYNRMTANISDANGLSIFFPYNRLPTLNTMLATYEEIGIDPAYSDCLRSFASLSAGGQIVSGGGGSLLDVLLGGTQGGAPSGGTGSGALELLLNAFLSGGDYSSITGLVGDALGWLDVGRIRSSLDYYAENKIEAADLVITVKDGERVLSLAEEKWDLVQFMEMNVFIDDGEGFIDLGLDNVYEYNQDGDLIMEYDGTWLALNGQIVSYYLVSDDRTADGYSIRGRVPALLNDQRVDIIIVFDDDNPYGVVQGAQVRYDIENQTETVAKGLLEIVRGDQIDFLCDYYTYEGEYIDSFFLGDRMIASGQWRVENLPVGDYGYQMTYRITDIYNNQYWTPSVRD